MCRTMVGGRLVASGVPVDYTDEADGWAAAHAAASAGHLDVLRFLASKDADLTRATSPPGCFNIVHLAARAGHLNVLEWLEDRMPGVVRPLYSLRDGKGRIPADSSANGEQLALPFYASSHRGPLSLLDLV